MFKLTIFNVFFKRKYQFDFSIVFQNEVTSLKTLLDTGSASSSSGFGHGSSEEDDDEKEIISQKEIIIARDQVSSINDQSRMIYLS